MYPGEIFAIIIIALIIVGALFYVIKEKKSGRKCIGCPYSNSCSKKSDKKGCKSYNENN